MNKHLTTYLEYYRALEKPGYAVLVTGDWGCGKTYQIKQYFKEHEICYVSLFSINSIDDIYATVFAKMHPTKAIVKKLVGSIGDVDASVSDSVTLGLGGILSRVGSTLIKENVDNKKIIIFDDLERAIDKEIINISEFLGVINNYIEHAGCKVIVIAHDGEIPTGFEKTKEKVIGQTLKVKSDINGALNTFLAKSELKRLYPDIKDVLLSAFEQSGYSSLRVLKYIINDCNRLYDVIKNGKLKSDESALYDLFYYFIILDLEFKHGKLSTDEYLNHNKINLEYQTNLFSDKEVDTPKIILISNKYKKFSFQNELISKEDVINIIFDGYFDNEKISENIDKSNYFKKEEEKPSWYKLTAFDDLEFNAIESATQELKLDFDNRKFNKRGDMYHLFNCMFMLEKVNNKEPDFEKTFLRCKEYLNDVFKNGSLELKNPKKIDFDMGLSYDGKSFWVQPEYEKYSHEIFNDINEMMYKAFHIKGSEYNVLDNMRDNITSLFNNLTSYRGNYGEYSDIPILHQISPSSFVNTWLSLSAINQNEISSLLRSRYDMGKLSNSLKEEKVWLKNVFDELDKKANSMTGLHAYRIERLKLHIPTE